MFNKYLCSQYILKELILFQHKMQIESQSVSPNPQQTLLLTSSDSHQKTISTSEAAKDLQKHFI